MNNWDAAFRDAHLSAWPKVMFSVQDVLFERDKAVILSSAKKHGFLQSQRKKTKTVWFFKESK